MATRVEGPRGCTKAEMPEVIAVVDAAMRQGSEQTFITDYPLVYGDANLANSRIIKVDGKVVSIVPYYAWPVVVADCRFTVGIISGTATLEEHRMKGYGLKCLDSCVEKMTREQIDISVLWTVVPTFRFYEHAAYQAVDCSNFVFECCDKDVELFADHGEKVVRFEPGNEGELRAIQSMHKPYNYGLLRRLEHYRVLFNLPRMKTLLAIRDEKLIAYLVVSRAQNKPGLLEAGGDRRAVETLVHHTLAELGPGEIINAHDDDNGTALGLVVRGRLPADRHCQPYQDDMMIRINNNRTFLQKISNWLVRKNGGREHSFSLTVTDTNEIISFHFSEDGFELGTTKLDPHLELSQYELTSVIFGCHRKRPVELPEPTAGLFPFSFPIWVLDRS